jgi:hypothetical protein
MSDQVMEQLAGIAKQNSDQIAMLSKQMATKTPANFGTFTELHGDGSLLGSQPVERDVITAHIRPMGIGSVLPKIPSVFAVPRFASITGFTATTGTEAAYPCSDNPQAYIKGCNLTAQFGRNARDTQTIEADQVMLRRNRGDFTDLILRGAFLGDTGFTPGGLDESQFLSVVTKSEMVNAAVQLERLLSTLIWTGNPANNNVGGGYKEMPGLDRQIATGQVDADTNTTCPALDSDVKDFAYDEVCGTGRDIVEYLGMLEFYLKHNAQRMGLAPVSWVIVMRPELWFVLSECWPCAYNTNRCAGFMSDTNANVNVSGVDMVSVRDQMRNVGYIDINGSRYPVVTDDGIFEHTNINNASVAAGQYASTIYMIPLTIQGGFPVTYLEHVDYRAWRDDVTLLRGTEEFWTDDGKYSWAVEHVKWCYKLSIKTEQRVILRTPQLAGRIDSVLYEPLQHLRSPYSDNAYFADGGVSLRGNDSTFHVW